MTDDELAALDSDWSKFTPAEQAAFVLARKVTLEPHRITDDDIAAVRKHYTELQVLEMLMSVAGNNSTTRWKEGVGVPQEQEANRFLTRGDRPIPKDRPLPIKSFLTPTSEPYLKSVTKVAPLVEIDGKLSRHCVDRREPLESRAVVEKMLAACEKRKPRLPVVDETKALELLPEDWGKKPVPSWIRLLANFPRDGKSRITTHLSADSKGDLKPLLKAQVSWIIARQDRAWYALGEARQRLKKLGQSDEQIFKLDGNWDDFSAADRSLFRLAKKLAATPIVLTDAEVNDALKQTGPREVVQMISYTTGRAYFNRVTEAAGLALEKEEK